MMVSIDNSALAFVPVTADSHPISPWRFCVAPMMDWTTTQCRVFHRLLSRHARLYTEMVTANAIIHGDRDHLLGFDASEHPVALQLGGSEADALAYAAREGQAYGYDEINLNCGCPSDRVQNGRFGACLMAEPQRVADCVAAMQAEVDIPVTVKCRLGIDELDSDEHLHGFIESVAAAGCRVFIVHARKAWLNGLSPKENREIPPLQYERVHALKRLYPELTIVINGGIEDLDMAQSQLETLDGVMLGRAAYKNPYVLAEVDQRLFGEMHAPSREQVVEALLPYVAAEQQRGAPVKQVSRHILGLYNGRPGAKIWRRRLSVPQSGCGVDYIRHALDAVQ